MKCETDYVNKDLIPFLIHFGEKGITPRVLSVSKGEIKTIRIEGRYLTDILHETPDPSKLLSIYKELGVRVGYISKYGVAHNDLHTANVVVEGTTPVIVDWESTPIMPMRFETQDEANDFWMGVNSKRLLSTTKRDLQSPETYSQLEKTYSVSFREELFSPLETSYSEIKTNAFRLFGII